MSCDCEQNDILYFTRYGRNTHQESWEILLQFCCKSTSLSVCQNLSNDKCSAVWQSYWKNKRVHFLLHSVVFPVQNVFVKLRRGAPPYGAWSMKNEVFDPMSRFTSEMIQNKAIVTYGTPIGSRMRYIAWCHFQWPWVTFEAHFSAALTLCAQLTRSLLATAKFLVIP